MKKILFIFVAILVFSVFLYIRFIPIGASAIPFLIGRAPESIEIDKGLTVYFNDAGAAHSGNHWCWIVKTQRGYRRVVAQGYVPEEVMMREQPLPMRQKGNVREVFFLTERYGDSKGEWLSLPNY